MDPDLVRYISVMIVLQLFFMTCFLTFSLIFLLFSRESYFAQYVVDLQILSFLHSLMPVGRW